MSSEACPRCRIRGDLQVCEPRKQEERPAAADEVIPGLQRVRSGIIRLNSATYGLMWYAPSRETFLALLPPSA
jgi:hypothetical protein